MSDENAGTPGTEGAAGTTGAEGAAAAVLERLAELLNGGRLADAEALALRLLEVERGSGTLWKLYGLARTLQGKEAVRELTEAARLMPTDADTHFLLGSAHRAAGNLEPAARALQAAVELRPDLAPAVSALAGVLAEIGRLDDAAGFYARAAQLSPDSAEAHNNLGNLMMRMHRGAEAVAAYREAVRVAPGNAAACTNLGSALRDLGQFQEALVYLRRAVEIEPGVAAAQYNLGALLLEQAQAADAEACFRRTLELEPRFLVAYTGLAMALRQQGRKRDGEAACRRSLDLEPANPAALALLADFVGDRAEYAEAEKLLRRAIEIDPDMPEALAGLVRFRRMGPADDGWMVAAQRLLDRGLPVRQEIALRFAAGKFHDDRGEADDAIDHFRRGNELRRRAAPPYDAQRHRAQLDARIAQCTRAWMESWAPRERSPLGPVFAVGMPRSGVSMVAQMLDAHPAARSAGELQFWVRAAAELESGGKPTDYGARYLRLLARREPRVRRMVDSMPANFGHLGLIHACLPDARFIHVRRHPADTCLAVYFQNFTTTLPWASDPADIVAFHRQYQRMMVHWREQLPAGTMLEIDFEDLAQDAERALRSVLDFLELPWEESCLRFHQPRAAADGTRHWQLTAPIGALEVGRWQRYRAHLGPILELLSPGDAAG